VIKLDHSKTAEATEMSEERTGELAEERTE
jgi:hypothetical protein